MNSVSMLGVNYLNFYLGYALEHWISIYCLKIFSDDACLQMKLVEGLLCHMYMLLCILINDRNDFKRFKFQKQIYNYYV